MLLRNTSPQYLSSDTPMSRAEKQIIPGDTEAGLLASISARVGIATEEMQEQPWRVTPRSI